MADSVKTSNRSIDITRVSGGAVRMTSVAGVSQGNGGTSRPCVGCFVSAPAANTAPTKFNIDAAASATLGAEIPEGTSLFIPIDDVSKLYFFTGGATDVVDVTWMI